MSSPRTPAAFLATRRITRLLGAALALAVIGTLAVLTAIPAQADSAVSARSAKFTIHGAGWGHGWGMSQYGAYGAARKGLSWKRILAFYYRGTQLSTMPSGTKIKVWITADNDSSLRVLPASGLRVRDSTGHSYLLPAGPNYTSWRISRLGSGYRLAYRTRSGSYLTKSTGLTTGTWSFSTPSKIVKVVLPSGSVRSYRGTLALIKSGSGGRTINTVLLEDYVRGVVPAEMPTSWAADAVRAQAVAARSYAVRLRDVGRYSGYDICDTTACQVYSGMGRETSNGNAAVRATAAHDRHLSRQGRTHPIRVIQRRLQRPRRLSLPCCAPRSLRRSDQVSGVDSRHQCEQHQSGLALGGDREAVADHQPRRRRRLGRPRQDNQDHRNLPHRDRLGDDLPAHVRDAFVALHDLRKQHSGSCGSSAARRQKAKCSTARRPKATCRASRRPAVECEVARRPAAECDVPHAARPLSGTRFAL